MRIVILGRCDGDCGMEEAEEKRRYKLPSGRALALCLSWADRWAGKVTCHGRQAVSVVVHGIESGTKLPLTSLANGTRDKVICHLPLLQSCPRKWGWPAESLLKTLSVQSSILRAWSCAALWKASDCPCESGTNGLSNWLPRYVLLQ